jgi:hypothetical protein
MPLQEWGESAALNDASHWNFFRIATKGLNERTNGLKTSEVPDMKD